MNEEVAVQYISHGISKALAPLPEPARNGLKKLILNTVRAGYKAGYNQGRVDNDKANKN